MLKIIAGPASCGKSTLLFRKIREEAAKAPERNFILCVPEQFSLTSMRKIMETAEPYGILNIDVLSFNRLSHRIFEEAGGDSAEVLDDTGKNLILRRIASEISKELSVLGSNLKKMGYIGNVKSVISELMQYGIAPKDMERMLSEAEGTDPYLALKLRDIRLIYERFEEKLGTEYVTREELLSRASLSAKNAKFLQGAAVCFDGFTGFTPVQYSLMEELYRITKDMTVTVTNDGSGKELFALGQKTEEHLYRIGGKDTKLERLPARVRKAPEFTCLSCQDVREETEYVIGQIGHLVKEQGFRYREIGIILGNPEYAEILSDAAYRRGLPVFTDRTVGIAMNPLSEMIRAVLSLVREDFTYETVIHFLRTDFSGLDRDTVDQTENYIRAMKLRGKKKYENPWSRRYRGIEEKTLLCAEEARGRLFKLLEPLYRLRTEASAGEFTETLYGLLLAVDAQERLERLAEAFEVSGSRTEAMQYRQIYPLIMQLFDRIVDLIGNEKMDVGEYAELMDAGLSELRIGSLPAGSDCVMAGDLMRSRFSDIRALFVLGMNEGNIPSAPEKGGLIGDRDRSFFKERNIELAPTAIEQAGTEKFYFYMNICKPSEILSISYAARKTDGSAGRPSFFLSFAKKLFAGTEKVLRDNTEITDREKALQKLSETIGEYTREAGELYRLFQETDENPEIFLDAAQGENPERFLRTFVSKRLYGQRRLESATELERYAACAYAHFLRYGLHLKEREDLEFEQTDLGSLLHSVLQFYSEGLEKNGRTFRDPADGLTERIFREALENAGNEKQEAAFSLNLRNAYLKKRVERIARRTIDTISYQVRSGSLLPSAFEKKFEYGGLKGYIDRIDRYTENGEVWLDVIDYKSGNKTFDRDRIWYGLDLQLTIYLSAAMLLESIASGSAPEKVHPAGIFYYHVDDPLVEAAEGESDLQISEKIRKELKLRGVVNSDQRVLTLLDRDFTEKGKSDIIPAAMKVNGELSDLSSAADEEELRSMMRYTEGEVRKLRGEILSGNISALPYELKGKSACTYCPYRGICSGGKARKLTGKNYPEAWNEK